MNIREIGRHKMNIVSAGSDSGTSISRYGQAVN